MTEKQERLLIEIDKVKTHMDKLSMRIENGLHDYETSPIVPLRLLQGFNELLERYFSEMSD